MKRKRLLTVLVLSLAAGCLFAEVSCSAKASKAVSIKIKGKKKVTLTVGKTKKLKVKLKGAKQSKVKWKSSNKKAVTVSKKGKIKAIAVGKASVTAKIQKKKVTFTVTVKKKPASGSKNVVTKEKQEENKISEFSKEMSNFSVNLLKSLVKRESQDKNTLISADSVATALSMAQIGAAGDTLTEFVNTLAPGMSQEAYQTSLRDFNQRITSANANTGDMHIADSLWIKNIESLKIKEDFISKNVALFDASVYREPFDDTTIKKVNDWVNEKTNQMIPSILDRISADDRMYLINAVAFEARWSDPFMGSQIVEGQSFTNQDGNKSDVTMLSGDVTYYITLKEGTGFLKYYQGGDFAFVGILPPSGMSNQEFLDTFTGNDFATAIINKKDDKDVHIKMPEFTYDYDAQLNEDLKGMGLQRAFSQDFADFSNMLEPGSDSIYIDSVLHKTHIELNRDGTKAAAVTAIIAKNTSAMIPMKESLTITLDRPFIYGIVDVETGIPIFMGAVNHL